MKRLVRIKLPNGQLDVWAYGLKGRAVRLSTLGGGFDATLIRDVDGSVADLASELVDLVTLISSRRRRVEHRLIAPYCAPAVAGLR